MNGLTNNATGIVSHGRALCTRESMRLYAVTDRRWLREQGLTLAQAVEASLQGGATFVQLREKSIDAKAFLEEAQELKALCQRYAVPFVIDDDVSVALASGADGVHVGQSDMGCAEARAQLGPDKILGVSVFNVEQALKAVEQGADYLGVGAMFPTGSKGDAQYVSMEELKRICETVDVPVVAIGGITEQNLTDLSQTGVHGIAVISAIFAQPDIKAASLRLRALADQAFSLTCENSREF